MPKIYNGQERITRHDVTRTAPNVEEMHECVPQLGTMVGRAVSVVCEPGYAAHPAHSVVNPHSWTEYCRYLASVPTPKIVVRDFDKPRVVGMF